MRGILVAHDGRVEMLRAIFGGREPDRDGARSPKLPPTAKNMLAAFRAMKGG